MCWKIWQDDFDKCRNDGCTEFFKDATEFVNSILQLRVLKIKSLEATLQEVKEIANRNEIETGYNSYDKIDLIQTLLDKS